MRETTEAHGGIIATDRPAATHRLGWLWLALPALLAVGLKAGLLAADAFPLNADESVVGLMARHLLQGARPVFFYGQAYMGSLDAWLVAGFFTLLGEGVLPIRLVQVLLYAGTVMTMVALAWQAVGTRRAAAVAGLMAAIPTVNVTVYTTVSLGGYGEAMLIGGLLLLLALRISRRPAEVWSVGLWGLLAGVGFWAFGLVLVYLLPSLYLIIASLLRRLTPRQAVGRLCLVLLATCAGGLPWLLEAVGGRLAPLLSELAGSAIAAPTPVGWLSAWGEHLRNLLIFGSTVIFGLRPPWEVRWLALPLLPVVFSFWLLVLARVPASLRRQDGGLAARRLLAAMGGILVAGFVVTPFGADPSGRYFVPLVLPLTVFAADLLESVRPRPGVFWTAALTMVVVVYNLWGTLDSAGRNPPGLTTQFDRVTWIDHGDDPALIEFLEAQGARRGYTNYWVAYPLAFRSQERLIFEPRLPYHWDFRYTARDDRYPPYAESVAASDEVAYITTNHPPLDELLRTSLAGLGVTYRERWIGDYHVFYALSEQVRPEALDLAVAE